MRSALTHFRTVLRSRRRLFVAGLLAIYATTAIGVPLPMAASATKSGEPFPCSTCGCGCTTAEECWRSCCCHTLAERIAWAQRHSVRPPAYVIAAAEHAGLDLNWLGIKSQNRNAVASCCEQDHEHANDTMEVKSLPPCCQKRLANTATAGQHSQHSRCQKANCSTVAKAPSPCPLPKGEGYKGPKGEGYKGPKGEGSKTTDRLVAWRAMECRGQTMNWLAATPTLVVDRPEFTHELPLVTWLGPAASEAATCVAQRPDLPPPERA